jgi:hypothetical protein
MAERMGRHFGPWVPTGARATLAERSLFRQAQAAGHSVTFANAYPVGHMDVGGSGARRPGAFPFAARAASLLERDEGSVRRGEGLVSSITTDSWRRYVDPDAPIVDPVNAGECLARISSQNDLTIFAHYDTDYVGHRGDFGAAVSVLQRVDAFLGGVLAGRSDDTLVLLTSDHGNLEDVSSGHTRNNVPFLAVGDPAPTIAGAVGSIVDVASSIMNLLGGSQPAQTTD